MSEGGIWTIGRDGALTAMRPSQPSTEDELQALIARYRELIGEEADDLLLVKREQEIADAEEASGRWSLDHLFVTRDAMPVLVEVKRASNTQLRREVVAQMLDYAANGAAYWSAGAAAQSFAMTCAKEGADPEQRLTEFLGPDTEASGFWERMDQNFRDGRLKMLFVADEIPQELATIVEFLNEHTRDHIEVRAIELRHFEGDGGVRTLMRRVIGQTEQARGKQRGPISIEDWIEREITPHGNEVVTGVKEWVKILNRLGALTKVASTQGSIAAYVEDYQGKKRYPLHVGRSGRGTISFNWVYTCPGVASEATRQKFWNRFNEAVGPLSGSNLKGYPAFPAKLLNDHAKAKAFEQVARDWLKAVCRPEDGH